MIAQLARVPRLATVATTLVLLAAGCGSSSSSSSSSTNHRGGTLTVLYSTNPDSIDPAIAYQTLSGELMFTAYDGLVTFPRAGGSLGATLVPDLATALPKPTDNGTTYTFHIRKGIHFSNGALVKPSDFRYTLIRDFKAGSPGTFISLVSIKGFQQCSASPKTCTLPGVVANDKLGTVTFHLTAPDPVFLDRLSLNFGDVVPAGTPEHDVGNHPIPSTGPYEIKSYEPNRQITLVRNPEFHRWTKYRPNGYPNEILVKLGGTTASEVNEVENNQADWMDDGDQPPADQLPKLATPAFASRVHLEPVAQTNYLTLDTQIPPFNNLDARRAVNYAIDRNAVVKLFGGPAVAQPTCQVLPPHFFAYKPYCPYTANPGPGGEGTWKAPDMAKARQLIAASHTAGDKVTVDMINSPPFNQLGVYVQTLFNQLGYHTTLHLLSHGVIYPTVGNSKNNVGATEIFWIADFPAAEDFFTNTLTCASFLPNSDANLNISQFCNHGLDSEINHALVVQRTSTTQANQLWTQIDRAATNLAPQVSLVNPRYVELTSSRVGHFVFNPLGYGLMDQMWVR